MGPWNEVIYTDVERPFLVNINQKLSWSVIVAEIINKTVYPRFFGSELSEHLPPRLGT